MNARFQSENINYREFPTEQSYPFKSEGPDPFFPSVCLQSHNDPTNVLKHILPQVSVPLPLGPRPWTKICMEYVNSATNEPPPKINAMDVYPGAEPNTYLASVGHESQLRRLGQLLRKCDAGNYIPNEKGSLFMHNLVNRKPFDSSNIPEAMYPKVLMTIGNYDCRVEADKYNMGKSNKPFFNATKQDRLK